LESGHPDNRFTALLDLSGTTRVSRYQKGKTRKGKTNLDLLEQEIVSGSGICWAICNAYSLQPPARSPPAGNTWVHLIPHSTHPQSSSLHGAVKVGSLSEIEKSALPPPCFPSFNFQSTRSQGATLALMPPVSYARTDATSAYVGLTVHRARSDAYHRNLTGR